MMPTTSIMATLPSPLLFPAEAKLHRLATGKGKALLLRRKRSRSVLFRCNSRLAEFAPAASAAYGALLLGGGLFAYNRSGSKGSLVGGIAGATLMTAAYFLMLVPSSKDVGDALGFGSAFLFTSIFGIRLAATRKVIPAGPLLGVSICALAVFTSAYLQDRF